MTTNETSNDDNQIIEQSAVPPLPSSEPPKIGN
jgi:hypothetical protein